jgi:glycosyltransferase involved in cell wall biosynthesis
LDQILANSSSGIKVELLTPCTVNNAPRYSYISVRKVGHLTGHAWEQIELPLYSFSGVLFTPGGGAPLIHPRNIVTIHDAAVFAAPSGYSCTYRTWYKFMYRVLCLSATRILTVSNFSKHELVRWCRSKPDKISVIYLGSEHARSATADDSILRRHNLTRYGYLLAVSSKNPNKNFSALIACLDHLPVPGIEVVIAGKTLNKVFSKTSLERSTVKDLGYVTDQELRSLYENAGCFVFPSLYEGFGLPPLEALSLGCPSVVSNLASMPEIFGGTALLCDPHDPSDIAEKIGEALKNYTDATTRERLSKAAMQYTWKKCAYETWALLLAAAS